MNLNRPPDAAPGDSRHKHAAGVTFRTPHDPKRTKYIAQLTKVVERVEKERVDSAREVVTDSPAPRAMLTAIFQQPQRSVFGGDLAPYGVGSPVPALGPLS